jgi:hypothetical protein
LWNKAFIFFEEFELISLFHKTVAQPVRHTEMFLWNSSDMTCRKQNTYKINM